MRCCVCGQPATPETFQPLTFTEVEIAPGVVQPVPDQPFRIDPDTGAVCTCPEPSTRRTLTPANPGGVELERSPHQPIPAGGSVTTRTDLIGDNRALHVCDLCGGVDDHSRHSFAGQLYDQFRRPDPQLVSKVIDECAGLGVDDDTRNVLVQDLLDTSISDRHRHCCRAAGCPTGDCDEIYRRFGDLRGAELVDALVTAADADVVRLTAEAEED